MNRMLGFGPVWASAGSAAASITPAAARNDHNNRFALIHQLLSERCRDNRLSQPRQGAPPSSPCRVDRRLDGIEQDVATKWFDQEGRHTTPQGLLAQARCIVRRDQY